MAIFLIEDEAGHKAARNTAEVAVSQVLAYINMWAKHKKVDRCVLSNIEGYCYDTPKQLRKNLLVNLLNRAADGAYITLLCALDNTALLSLTIHKVTTEENNNVRCLQRLLQ